jgi:type 1 fimbria pilin
MKILARTLSVFLLVTTLFAHAYSPQIILVDATDPGKYEPNNDGHSQLTNTGPQYHITFRNPGVKVLMNVTTDPYGMWSSGRIHALSTNCSAPVYGETTDSNYNDNYFFKIDDNFGVKSCTDAGSNTLNPHLSTGANSATAGADIDHSNTAGFGNIILWIAPLKDVSSGLYGGQHLLYKQRYCLLRQNCSATSFDAKDANGNYLVQGEVDVWLNYNIVIPTSCTINSGTVVKVELPAVSSGALKVAGEAGLSDASVTKQIPIACTGNDGASATIELRLGGPSPVGLPGVLSSSIPGVGVAVRDENPSSPNYQQNIVPNSSSSFASLTSDSNGSSTATLSFRPVYTGNEIYPGNYTANGILVANIP